MVLEEAVALLPKAQKISIGSLSGFIFIGTVEEYYKMVGMIEDDVFYVNCIKHLDYAANNLWHRAQDLYSLHKTCKNPYDIWTIYQRVTNAYDSAKNTAQYARMYSGLRERSVKELWYNDYDKRFQIIIEGLEIGEYWLESEYLEDFGPSGKKYKPSKKKKRKLTPKGM